MNPYLQRIWNRLVRSYQLRIVQEDDEVRILCRKHSGEREGGKKNYTVTSTLDVLTYHRKSGYLDFQKRVHAKKFYHGKFLRDEITKIYQHITVNASGSIRRRYLHDGVRVAGVRTISLKNYYLIEDAEVARLIMVTSDELDWVHELPLTFHPISNSELKKLKSLDDLFEYFTGENISVPKRIRSAFPLRELLVLLQIVPGTYLNVLAATLKSEAKYIGTPLKVQRLILAYYRHSLSQTENPNYQLVYSYVNACRALGRKLNMRIKSEKKLAEERDSMSHQRIIDRSPEIKTHREFILPESDYGDFQLELINSKSRIIKEARGMKSCVDTYICDITDGICGIYHVVYRKRPYTLELMKDGKGKLYVNQLLGVSNAPGPLRLKKKVEKVLRLSRRGKMRKL